MNSLFASIGLIAISFELPVQSASVRLEVEPAEIRLDAFASRQQIAVTGRNADGSLNDLTGSAKFSVENADVATVSPLGVILALRSGETALKIEADSQSTTIPIHVSAAPSQKPASYRLDITPIFSKAGCNMGACHGNMQGKGGFRLSLRGEDPTFDLISLTREALGRRVDPQKPEASLVVLKPTGQVAHEGGLRVENGSIEAKSLLSWIKAGAKDDLSTAPKLSRLVVSPSERFLSPQVRIPHSAFRNGGAQQLIVTAEFSDGSRRDVTRQAAFDLNDPSKATISPDGLVTANGPCEVVVAVRYQEGRGVSRLAFLPDRPDYRWNEEPGQNPIDRAVFAKLKALKIQPTERCSDIDFLRRSFLDCLGVLPSAEEAKAFLADQDLEKRAKLVDKLLNRPEFADFWALKWADLLRNEEKAMSLKGVWSFQRWLRNQVSNDVPMDRFAREIVSSLGSTYQNPPASYYRTNQDPQSAAESFGQVFLGVRLQCARCHNHPFDSWTQDDYYGLAGYFANVKRREVYNIRSDDLDKHEINGDVIVYLEGSPGMIQPRSGRPLAPKPPGGKRPDLKGKEDALDSLADWLTRENAQFSRNLANRVWFHLMGRGVVEPVDDFRESNPPSNTALLEALSAELIRNGVRLKPLVALIMKSKTYQFGSRPNATNASDEANFSRATIRLLPAEVLLDAIGQALDRPERYNSAPKRTRAVELAGVKMGSDFLKVFGKPDRLLTCECERSDSTTLAQAFQLINGADVRSKLRSSENRLGRLIESKASPDSILSELYLSSLSREPSESEKQVHLAYLQKADDKRKAWEDVAWALLNSKEFLLRH